MAKLSLIAKAKRKPKFAVRDYTRCRYVRPAAGLPPEVRDVPHLLPEAGPRRGHPRRDQGQLVGEAKVNQMNMTDPVADMITRIRNGVRARLPKVDVPASKLKVEIARILKDEGYIANFKTTEDEQAGRASAST